MRPRTVTSLVSAAPFPSSPTSFYPRSFPAPAAPSSSGTSRISARFASQRAKVAPCFQHFYRLRVSPPITCFTVMATEPVEVIVKGAAGEPDKLGDCPFSQRVLLTLEEKGIPYNLKVVDLDNKPDWFLEANPEGKVPVIKHGGKWVADSDVITQILEEIYPEPSLVTPTEKASVGTKIFPSFVKFLKSKDPGDGTEAALVAELKALNDYLRDHGPFINGDKISAADLNLAPKLFHLQVALGHYKKWSIPNDLTYLNKYIETLHAQESFVKTKPAHEHVVAGWKKHIS